MSELEKPSTPTPRSEDAMWMSEMLSNPYFRGKEMSRLSRNHPLAKSLLRVMQQNGHHPDEYPVALALLLARENDRLIRSLLHIEQQRVVPTVVIHGPATIDEPQAGALALFPDELAGALALFRDERRRQVAKGFTAEHDDRHTEGEILTAAGQIIYDLEGGTHTPDADEADDPDATWMDRLRCDVLAKYPDDPVRRMVIAGALIAAEVDRLLRARDSQ